MKVNFEVHHGLATLCSLASALCLIIGTSVVFDGNWLVTLPAALLARYVWSGYGVTVTTAAVLMTVPFFVDMSLTLIDIATIAIATYLAIEIAEVGARGLRHKQHAFASTDLKEIAVAVALAVGCAIVIATAHAVQLPAWARTVAMGLVAAGALVFAVRHAIRTAEAAAKTVTPEPEQRERATFR